MNTLKHNGYIYYRAIFNSERILVADPEGLNEIATRIYDFPKPLVAPNLAEQLLGIGLVLSEGEQHKQQRRAFLPSFAPRHIREMYPLFWSKAREVTEKLSTLMREHELQQKQQGLEAQPWTFEAGHWAARMGLDVITLAATGQDVGCIEDENAPMSLILSSILRPTREFFAMGVAKWYLSPLLVESLPLKLNREATYGRGVMRASIRKQLRERRKLLAESGSLPGKDLLSVCLRYEEVRQCSEEEVIDQMMTLLSGGHETVAVGITWAIYMLCLHQDWQRRLREEVRAHFPRPDDLLSSGPVATELENEMPLLQAFILEAWRRYPPIPMTQRQAARDTHLGELFIPKNTRLIIPISGMCRDERFWGPDAAEFRPERWLTTAEDGTTKLLTTGGVNNKYGNLMFMHGQRSCVGAGLAKAETAVLVGSWVGRFEFDLADEHFRDERNMEVSGGGLSGKPVHGLHVKIQAVDGW